MYLLIKKTSLFYNKIVGSKYFLLFNLMLKITNPISELIIELRVVPNFIKGIALLNIYYHARYNLDFECYFLKRSQFINFLNHNIDCGKKKFLSKELEVFKSVILLDKLIQDRSFNKAKSVFYELCKKLPQCLDYEIFKEKKILYIGSAPVIMKDINFSNFDLIIVNNFLENDLISKKIPLKKTVIFYNKGFAARYKNEIKKLSKVCRSIYVKDMDNSEYKRFIEATYFLANDYGSMGAQNVLLALVLGSASEVTVHGVNGFLSKNSYTKGLKKYTINEQHISNILRRHEFISNHHFLVLVFNIIQINGSEEFVNLAKLKTSSYSRLINKKYGKFLIKRLDGYGF